MHGSVRDVYTLNITQNRKCRMYSVRIVVGRRRRRLRRRRRHQNQSIYQSAHNEEVEKTRARACARTVTYTHAITLELRAIVRFARASFFGPYK